MSTCCRGHGLDMGGAATVLRPLAVLTPGGLVESTQEHRTREGMGRGREGVVGRRLFSYPHPQETASAEALRAGVPFRGSARKIWGEMLTKSPEIHSLIISPHSE